jgi:hypothetical protein
VEATLQRYPRLRATRLFEMVRQRGYGGSVVQLRRLVRTLRPRPAAEAYLRLTLLPAEQAQVDWGAVGTVQIGHARRPLSAFVMVLSWSRALHAVFTLDQTLESFLRGHVEASSRAQPSGLRLFSGHAAGRGVRICSAEHIRTSVPGRVMWPRRGKRPSGAGFRARTGT